MLAAERSATSASSTTPPAPKDPWSTSAYVLGALLILGGIIAALAASDSAASMRYTGRARSVSPDFYIALALAGAVSGMTLVIVGRIFRLLASIEFNTRSR